MALTAERAGFPFTFACRRSGNCCARPGGMVRVTGSEARAIAVHVGLTLDAFASRYLAPSRDSLKEGLGGRCVFLEDGAVARCGIYPVRPAKCRTWPFWPELLESPEALAEARRLCPGIEDRAPSG